MEPTQNDSSSQPTEAQPTEPTPPQTTTTTAPPSAPKRKLPWLWIGIGAAVLVIIIVVIVAMTGGNRNQQSNDNKQAGLPSSFTIGAQPYIYGCSVLTPGDFAKAFGLQESPTIGVTTSTDASLEANTKNEADLLKIENLRQTEAIQSDCKVSAPRGNTIVTFDAQWRQFADPQRAAQYLDSQKRFTAAGAPPLASFPQTSAAILPKADSGLKSVKAIVVHKNSAITASYLMADDEAVEAIVSKFDTLFKTITANMDNKDLATKPASLDGHATTLNKPFIDTCKRIGLRSVAQKLGINIRVDAVDNTGQYGALPGSSAAGDGVASTCSVDFNTKAEQDQLNSKPANEKGISIEEVRKQHPHTLLLATNRFANADDAAKALAAKKQRQTRPEITIEDVTGIGDGGYKLHKEIELPNFSINNTGKDFSIEDSYIIRLGDTMITINLQQSKNNETMPVTLTEAQAKEIVGLFGAMLK